MVFLNWEKDTRVQKNHGKGHFCLAPKKKVTYVSKKTVLSKQRTVLSYFFELIIKIGEKDTSVTIFEKFEPTKIEALRRTATVNEH